MGLGPIGNRLVVSADGDGGACRVHPNSAKDVTTYRRVRVEFDWLHGTDGQLRHRMLCTRRSDSGEMSEGKFKKSDRVIKSEVNDDVGEMDAR